MMLGKCERCGGDHYATECQSGCEAVTPTPEERAAAVVSRWVGYPQADAMPQTVRDISDAIRSAVLAEREALEYGMNGRCPRCIALKGVAVHEPDCSWEKAIRARGEAR